MKNLLMPLLIFTLNSMAGVPIEKVVPVNHVFAPSGFDSNDNTEIVIKGFLPNLCHKSPSSKVEIKGKNVTVKITSLFYHETSPFCPEMVVPFTETVNLGILNKGDYKIIVNAKTAHELKEDIKVAESTSSSIDEFSYAYVNYIEKEETQKGYVVLKGYNPSDCFELDSISYVHNKKDTYSIMPRMKQVSDFCPMKMVPFSYEWKVPSDLSRNEVLLHVRTLNGKSINTLYTK